MSTDFGQYETSIPMGHIWEDFGTPNLPAEDFHTLNHGSPQEIIATLSYVVKASLDELGSMYGPQRKFVTSVVRNALNDPKLDVQGESRLRAIDCALSYDRNHRSRNHEWLKAALDIGDDPIIDGRRKALGLL